MNTHVAAMALALICCLPPAFAAQRDEADRQLCQKYRERLQSFENHGVMAYDPRSGNLQRMSADQARIVIERTRERVAQLCR